MPVSAQGREIGLEISIFKGTVSLTTPLANGVRLGFELGVGTPQLDRTWYPPKDSTGGPSYEEFLHVGAFVRSSVSSLIDVDTGIRLAFSDLWLCDGDCLPRPAVAVYVQPMVGRGRFTFGPRLLAGWIAEGEPMSGDSSTPFVSLSPITARWSIPW